MIFLNSIAVLSEESLNPKKWNIDVSCRSNKMLYALWRAHRITVRGWRSHKTISSEVERSFFKPVRDMTTRKVIMEKEHRCCARKALDRELMIGYPQTGFVRAQVRDISLGGMCIETTASLALNTPVELLFRAQANGAPRMHRWRATVRHIAPEGIGLRYEPFVLTELPALLGLLQAADLQAADKARAGNPPGFGSSPVSATPVAAPSGGPQQDDRTSEYDQ